MALRTRAQTTIAVIAAMSVIAALPRLQAQSVSGSAPMTAASFLADAERRLNDLTVAASRAAWVQSTYITDDTELLAAAANERLIAATTELATAAARLEGANLTPEESRKLHLLRLLLPMPAPSNESERSELTRIAASLEADYGKGKYCPKPDQCLDISAIEKILRESRDPRELADVWTGWRTIAPPMKDRYARFVELSNKGAKEMGFADVGAMWRSNYDMPPDAFAAEVERLWQQVRPLYESLHAYVRARLGAHYGTAVVKADGLIPAHLLGNLWAQQWGNVYSSWRPRDCRRDTTSRRSWPRRRWTRAAWCATARASSHRWASRRCQTPSGSARSSSSRATVKSCAMPARGPSTTRTTSA